MEETKNLVVFDFCETIVNFQTADRFVDFVVEDNIKSFHRVTDFTLKFLTKIRVIPLINLFIPKWNISKRLKLIKLKGVEEGILNSKALAYVNSIIQNGYNIEILKKLRDHKEKGDYIIISSGGFHPYLNIFSEKEGVNKLFCTQIEIRKDISTGKIKGFDCMFENKVKLLEDFIVQNKELRFKETIVYTDSISDLPLLKWAHSSFVISYNKSQGWVKKYNFNEIILKR